MFDLCWSLVFDKIYSQVLVLHEPLIKMFCYRFLWQICGFIPQTLENPKEMTEMAAQLTTTFFLETFIHSKEKVNEELNTSFSYKSRLFANDFLCVSFYSQPWFSGSSCWRSSSTCLKMLANGSYRIWPLIIGGRYKFWFAAPTRWFARCSRGCVFTWFSVWGKLLSQFPIENQFCTIRNFSIFDADLFMRRYTWKQTCVMRIATMSPVWIPKKLVVCLALPCSSECCCRWYVSSYSWNWYFGSFSLINCIIFF